MRSLLLLLLCRGILLNANKWVSKISTDTKFDDYVIGNQEFIEIDFSLHPHVLGMMCVCFFAEMEAELGDAHGCNSLPGLCVGRATTKAIVEMKYEFAGSATAVELTSEGSMRNFSKFHTFAEGVLTIPFVARFYGNDETFAHRIRVDVQNGELLSGIDSSAVSAPLKRKLNHVSDRKNVKIRDMEKIYYRWMKTSIRDRDDKRTIAVKFVCKLEDCAKGTMNLTNLQKFPGFQWRDEDNYEGISGVYDVYYSVNDTVVDLGDLPRAVDILYNVAMGIFIFVASITTIGMLLQCYVLLFYNR